MGSCAGPKASTQSIVVNYDTANISSYSGSGITLNNLVQSSFGATLSNGPTFSSNNKGYLTFAAASSQFGTFADFGSTFSAFTIEAWYYLNSLPSVGTVQSFVTQKFTSGLAVNFSLGFNGTRLTGSYDGKINGGFWNGSWRLTSGFTPSINTWYQSVATYDGTTIYQYTNGLQVDSYDPGVGNRTTFNSAIGNYLMRRWDTTNFVDGRLAIVRIYNRALTDIEILRNYNANKARFGLT